MYYTIYQITNLVNNKTYIGKHITKDINDSYMGLGKLLRVAITKYGIENFTKEILFLLETEEEMNLKERELVTEEFCLRKDTYNLCVGGQGGVSYINRSGINVDIIEQRKRNPLIINKAAVNVGRKKWLMENDNSHIQESIKKISQGLKNIIKLKRVIF